MPFTRYRSIIPEWEAFEASRFIPEPMTIRVRSGKISADELLPRLSACGFHLEPVEGIPDFFRVTRGPGSIAQTLEYWLGLFHIQQAVMALPSLALAPLPGERILDLCAAPGGKTAHLAELMEERGPLVAVDPKEKRLRALLANIYRLGYPNVLVIAADGRQLPLSAQFDRVLVDAPCSAEGTFRRQAGKVPKRSPSFVSHITRNQEALLRRAVALTRPGGTILYSTCTFAPEENEAIVDRVLRDSPIAVERISLDLPHSPGLTEWQGRSYSSELREAWRVYPHQLDAGGLFMVRLQKLPASGTSGSSAWGPVPSVFPGEDVTSAAEKIERSLHELESFFHISPERLRALGWMVRNENLWAHTAGEWPLPGWLAEEIPRWRVVSIGLRAMRDRGSMEGGRATPSTQFVSRWGTEVGADRQYHLSDGELRTLLGGSLQMTEGRVPGAVVLRWQGVVLGRGIVRVGGELVSEIPTAQRARLREILFGTDGASLNDPAALFTEDVPED